MKDFLTLNRNLQLRLAIVFLGAFSYGSVFSSMTIYYNQNMGAALTGLILIVSSLIVFASGLLAGHLADIVGRKPPMIWGIVAEFVGALIALISNSALIFSPWLTFVGFLLVSSGYNFVITTGNAMIIDLTEMADRKIVFALDYWAQNLSVILGAALGAWLFRDHFFDLLLILTIVVAVTFVIAQFFITESVDLANLIKSESESFVQVYLTVAKDKTYMIFMAANILASAIIMQFDNFMPVHLANDFQTFRIFGQEIYGQRMFTFFLIVACLLVVFFMTPVNRWFKNVSHGPAYTIGIIFMTSGMMLSFLTTSFWPIFIAAFIYTFGEIVYTPLVQTVGAEMMDPEKIGAYNGAAAMRQPISSIIASLMVSLSAFIHAVGVSILLALLAGLSVFLLLQAIKRHESVQI